VGNCASLTTFSHTARTRAICFSSLPAWKREVVMRKRQQEGK
jgi:hypothetical protein